MNAPTPQDAPVAHAEAVRLYMEGVPVKEIYARTGISKPQLYLLLRQRGITPNRQTPDRRYTPGLDASQIQMQLHDALVMLGKLRAKNERLRSMLIYLRNTLAEHDIDIHIHLDVDDLDVEDTKALAEGEENLKST